MLFFLFCFVLFFFKVKTGLPGYCFIVGKPRGCQLIFKSGVDEILWCITVHWIRPLSMLLIGSQYLFTNILGKQVWDVVQFQILLKQRMLLKRGTGNGERGTEVWERVVSGNLHKNPKWLVRITNPVRSMIEKRRNNAWRRYFSCS